MSSALKKQTTEEFEVEATAERLILEHKIRKLELLLNEVSVISRSTCYFDLSQHMELLIQQWFNSDAQVQLFLSARLLGIANKEGFFTVNADNSIGRELNSELACLKENHEYIQIYSEKDNQCLAFLEIVDTESMSVEQFNEWVNEIRNLRSPLSSCIENIHFLNEEIVKQRLHSELHAAREIQRDMLPADHLSLSDISISCFFKPANECGGDWWTHMQPEPHRHLLLLGDVTGHGTGSAMMTAAVKGFCEAHRKNSKLQIVDLLTDLNSVIHDLSQKSKRLMTMVAVEVNSQTQQLTMINAGHTPPIFIPSANTGLQPLCVAGQILGASPSIRFQPLTVNFSPDDQLLLYTDGLLENCNSHHRAYSDRRLLKLLENGISGICSEQTTQLIKDDFLSFIGEHDLEDDVTVLVCKFLKK